MPITLTGLASGLDTESIISQLMQIEQTKVTAVQKRQVSVNQHKTDLQIVVKSKLDAFKTAATDLGNASLWKAKQATVSSDPTKVEATVGSAGIGGQSIQVDRLASSAQHGFNYTAGSSAGKIGFTSGSTTVAIDIAADATPADVAAAINGSDSAPVYATVVKDGGVDKLVSPRAPPARTRISASTRPSSARAPSSTRTAPTPARARRSTRRSRSTGARSRTPSPTSSRRSSPASA